MSEKQPVQVQVIMPKSPVVAYLLWFFLGGLGAHRFYLGRPQSALGMLALNLLGWATVWFVIGWVFWIALAIWWIVDAFLIPGMIRSAGPEGIVIVSVGQGTEGEQADKSASG